MTRNRNDRSTGMALLRGAILFLALFALSFAQSSLLKTGQTTSYAEFDDGHYKAGKARSYSRDGDVVTDKVTLLEWQDNETVHTTWEEAVTYCSNLSLDNGGWRLPSIEELETLVDNGRHDPAVTEGIFNHYLSTHSTYYSSTFGASRIDYPGIVRFNNGDSNYGSKYSSDSVRCVRGEQLDPSSLSRNSEIVTDSATTLQWQDNAIVASTKQSWDSAIDYCENTLTLGGHDDWRLPNKNELLSIVDRSRDNPAINDTVFVNTGSPFYWSSTSNTDSTYNAWYVDFRLGGSGYTSNNYFHYVRCVRGGQFGTSNTFKFIYDLNKIEHTIGSDISNTFSIYLKNFKSLKDENGDDLEEVSTVCGDYFFRVSDSQGYGATQVNCQFDGIVGQDNLAIDFRINNIVGTRQAYFENAEVQACMKNNPINCTKLHNIADFTIYGTLFDLKKDAFSFKNGAWNKAILSEEKNDISLAGSAISTYLHYVKRFAYWNSIGYIKENSIFYDWTQKSVGLCYGMAMSCAANYNNRDKVSWGIGGNIKTEWPNQISQHKNEYESKPKPFDTNNVKTVYDYKKNNIEALKKIMYYFVYQTVYDNYFEESWVGSEVEGSLSDRTVRTYAQNILKNGEILEFSYEDRRYDNKDDWGHSVNCTQYLSYNGEDKWYIYNNNFGDSNRTQEWYWVKDNSDLKITNSKNNLIYYTQLNSKNEDISTYKIARAFVDKEDTLGIYNTDIQTNSRTLNTIGSKELQNITSYDDYNLLDHTTILLVGGEYISVIDQETSTIISPLPIIDELAADTAYAHKSSIFKNKLYLPANKTYQVTVEKDPSFPFMKIYIKKPDSSGTVELLNYENVQIGENAATVATFLVGGNNSDKSIQRDGADDYQPDFDQTYTMKIGSVESATAAILADSIQLDWTNSDHPNFKEVVIVRKENTKPANRNDGTVVYTGTDETFTDITVANSTHYFYALYNIANDDSVSDAVYLSADTAKYSIYGSIQDSEGEDVSGVSILLKDFNSSEILNMTSSGTNGMFTFGSLVNGSYNLIFSHPFYTIIENNITVTVKNQSVEIDKNAIGHPVLAIEVNRHLQIGQTESISWNGVNIETDQIDVKLYRDSTGDWSEIAADVDYPTHSVTWGVVAPQEMNATIRVTLQSDPEVYAEKNVTIFRDGDSDGYPDSVDAFPDNPNEWLDTDSDGIGNNADTDDDNDDMSDAYEILYGFDIFDGSDANEDADGDGYTNLEEYEAGTDPTDPLDHNGANGINPAIIMYLLS